MHLKNPITADSFKIHAPAGAKKVKALVMDTLPYMPFTNRRDVELPVVDGVVQCDVEQDVLYIAQVERHGKNGNVGKAFMGGFHIRGGAMASSVGHDNHNIIVMGDSFEDMALAVNRCVDLHAEAVKEAKIREAGRRTGDRPQRQGGRRGGISHLRSAERPASG